MMFAMCGKNFQRDYTHAVPKSTKRHSHPGQRVSITFRYLTPRTKSSAPNVNKVINQQAGNSPSVQLVDNHKVSKRKVSKRELNNHKVSKRKLDTVSNIVEPTLKK